jgi:hypothetical protein
MHIALGVSNRGFPIDKFLGARGRSNVTIETAAQASQYEISSLAFSSNPNRRGGEWLIRDQFSHRHPAWSEAAGFPATYDPHNAPYILVFRVGSVFHVRFATAKRLANLNASAIPEGMLSEVKGIQPASVALLAAFRVPAQTILDIYEEASRDQDGEVFDPKTVEDGRKRVMAAILQRLGQQAFRRKLVAAYGKQCAVTRCGTLWVLEAAHITPYRGLKTNAVSNGLLLRADIHTLFDLALISIEPARMKIRVSSRLAKSPYEAYEGKKPALPVKSSEQPSMAALEEHYSLFYP